MKASSSLLLAGTMGDSLPHSAVPLDPAGKLSILGNQCLEFSFELLSLRSYIYLNTTSDVMVHN